MERPDTSTDRRAWRDFLRLWPHLARHWGWLSVSAVSMVVFAVTTAAYAWLIGPVLRFIFSDAQNAPPGSLPPGLWNWLVEHRDAYPLILAALVLCLAAVRGVK